MGVRAGIIAEHLGKKGDRIRKKRFHRCERKETHRQAEGEDEGQDWKIETGVIRKDEQQAPLKVLKKNKFDRNTIAFHSFGGSPLAESVFSFF